MDPCCAPYCFLVSLTGFLLLVSDTQTAISFGLGAEYEYLHIHAVKEQAVDTALQAAFVLLVPALISGLILLKGTPERPLPSYLLGPEVELTPIEGKQPNAAFDGATNTTPLLSRD